MMNQPKPYPDHACTPIKSDGTGSDIASILGATDGTVLVVGIERRDSDDIRR